jgi:transaldolase
MATASAKVEPKADTKAGATAAASGPTQLEQLAKMSVIVADTGDFNLIREHKPTDATTNPTLIKTAAQMPQYAGIVRDAIAYGRKQMEGEKNPTDAVLMDHVVDKLTVSFGAEIVKIITGVVSTEVDARLSFDTEAMVAKAYRLIALYEAMGVPRNRVLIKLSGTWEGIQACKRLEKEGIHCNVTLLFSKVQAAACGEANATLISPFVGRIGDFHKAKTGKMGTEGEESLRGIYTYMKAFGYRTIVMGASFRSVAQVLGCAGCDKLTIGPQWLDAMRKSHEPVTRVLDPSIATSAKIAKIPTDEASFRFALNEDDMANTKLSEGIRLFAADTRSLEAWLAKLMNDVGARS